MPSNLELTQKLDVCRSNISDPLTLDDLRSAKTTRTASHARLIERQPGEHTIGGFAKRLGKSKRTIYRYNAEDDNIHSEPRFEAKIVTRDNLEQVIPADPDDLPHDGFFLVDSDGKKYPPKQGIARKLLAKKKTVILKRRLANYWWYGDPSQREAIRLKIAFEEKLAMGQAKSRQQAQPRPQERVCAVNKDILAQCEKNISTNDEAAGQNQTTIPQPPEKRSPAATNTRQSSKPKLMPKEPPEPPPSVNFRQPLEREQDEYFAQYVYQRINELSEGKEGQINIYSARRLVVKYGETEVRKALELVAKRNNTRKPVGFISTVLRSNAAAKRWAAV